MSASSMGTLTASLERSLQNCSLNHNITAGASSTTEARIERSSSPGVPHPTADLASLSNCGSSSSSSSWSDSILVDLDSCLSLPRHWEQCLDLKTGEVYYINWKNGMKAKRDPRLSSGDSCRVGGCGGGLGFGYCYSGEDEDSHDSEGSSTGDSSAASSRGRRRREKIASSKLKREEVLVVAGCRSCLMYFMLPKHLDDCPKCTGQLLHFDRSEHLTF